jgi:hypothetical protein
VECGSNKKETTNAVKSTKKVRQENKEPIIEQKSPGWLDLRALDLGCLRCGEKDHWQTDCSKKFDEVKCEACERNGHARKVFLETIRAEMAKLRRPTQSRHRPESLKVTTRRFQQGMGTRKVAE